ncbi:MAG: hypothetical protein QNJ98_03970 [Planctomycetota bacterium]|nr:hypothetical protein [Planctomycetota bacterium]
MKLMRSLALPLLLAIPLLWLGQDAYSCIRFKKPQGSVPPGLREPSDPTPPPDETGDVPDKPTTPDAPSPSMPTTPTTAPPTTGPQSPATPNGGGTRKAQKPDEATWEIWWELNRIDYFPHRWVAPAISPDESGLTPAGPQALHPSVVDAKLWPVLMKSVDDKQVFTQEAALITMGRVAANEEQRQTAREILVKKLDHRNHLIARSAALGLFYVANEETILPMYQRAMDKDVPEDVRAFLALTMTNLEHPMAPQLLKELADVKEGYYELVGAAIMGLGYVGAEQDPSVPAFLEDIAFGKKKVRGKYRALAVGSFGRMGDLTLGKPIIVKALTDRETDVRRSAAMAAGVLDYRTEAERQIEAIRAPYREYLGIPMSKEDETKIEALQSLVKPQQAALAKDIKAVVKALGKAMRDDKDSFVRRISAISLGRIAEQTPHGALGLRFLRDQVDKDRLGMREFAMLALAIAQDGKGFEAAQALIKERNPSTRGAACIAMGILGRKDRHNPAEAGVIAKADAALRDIINKDKHPFIRGYACLALGMVGNSDAAKLIQHTVRTTSTPETRAYGMLGLALLGTKKGANDVVGIIQTDQMKNGFVASHAVYALGLTKDRRPSTFDSLIEKCKDRSDMYVQAASLAAVGYLSSGEFYPRRHKMAKGYNYRVGYDFIETYFYKL